jgi:predicted DsbA family dithiol-disulfide isomerase
MRPRPASASNRWLSNSHRALELAEFARDRGKFDAVHSALFVAYFEQARDIGDIDVLMELAAENGLDPDEFGIEILNGRYEALIDRTTAIAHERGLTSTPTMVFNDQVLIPGAQDYNVYRALGACAAPG